MDKDTRCMIWKMLSDYAKIQGLEMRDLRNTSIYDPEWHFAFYLNDDIVIPRYSIVWDKVNISPFTLVYHIIDNFEHNCNVFYSLKHGYTYEDSNKPVLVFPEIKNVIFNNPATIVFWSDGTKTVVQTREGDDFDPEKGLAMAISKKMLGNRYEYYNIFKHWLKKAPLCSKDDIDIIEHHVLDSIAQSASKSTACINDFFKAMRHRGVQDV